ncbi:histidine kinase N-terminal 7TM domain-containing protein [Halorientalis litorea]|uniref:histidine kinase N-terminal 7TM domain-containing protein n=1 Tax=Halorientalis litorea TaxID=2931977 RepID=UPI001FF4967B|nr:histidine kinase N-terminal 7TM domain-containing protein [Halorientalis litorea]
MAAANVGLWFGYVTLLAVSIATQIAVGYWVYARQWDRDGARWFLAFVVSGILWTAGILLYLLPVGQGTQRAGFVVATIGSIVLVVAFVAFVSTYIGDDLHRSRAVQAILAISVVATIVLGVTNSSHHLMFTSFTQRVEPFPHLVVDRGIATTTILTVVQLFAFYAAYRMAKSFLASGRRSAAQFALFILGALLIGTLDIIGLYTDVMPVDGFTHAVFGLIPFHLLTIIALFRFRLFDVKPVARNTIIESLRDPVVVLDDRNRVVDYNDAATHVWPDIDERSPATFESVCPALAAEVSIPPAAEGETEQVSLTYDGQDRHYSVTISTVANSGNRTGWYAVLLRDITELEQSRWQLEKQNDRLDQVASTISHDLRNPISVITGQVEMMDSRLDRADLGHETEASLREEMSEVDGAADRMQDIIDDILTIAREGKTVEDTEKLSLAAVVHDAWRTVDTGDATLTVADDRVLQAERSKLLSIFENLFRNSVEHGSTAQNGPDSHGDYQPAGVTVEVAPTPDGFTVTDDGPGIPESHRENVFEYGYTTTRAGTGLGLSIVRTMAESHGWTVELDDDYHDGTRFVFHGVEGETVDPDSQLREA